MTMEELGNESIKHSEQLKTLFGKVDELSEKMNAIESLTLSVQKLAISVETLAKNQSEDRQEQRKISDKLIQLESAPIKSKADTHDKIVGNLVLTILGIIVGYLAKTLFGI